MIVEAKGVGIAGARGEGGGVVAHPSQLLWRLRLLYLYRYLDKCQYSPFMCHCGWFVIVEANPNYRAKLPNKNTTMVPMP